MEIIQDRNISNISTNIIRKVNSSEAIEDEIKVLMLMCSGPERHLCEYSFTGVLNSSELMTSLLKLKDCQNVLKDKPSACVAILDTLIVQNCKSWDVMRWLIENILISDYDQKKNFIDNIWSKKDTISLPSSVVLILINEEPKLVEEKLVSLYFRHSTTDVDPWKSSKDMCWISWSSQSSEIFTVVVSILNQLFILAKLKNRMLKIISDFILNIIAECELNNYDFVGLYPIEYQTLISILMLEPELNPCKNIVINKFNLLKRSNPTLALMFLSHFKNWNSIIKIEK